MLYLLTLNSKHLMVIYSLIGRQKLKVKKNGCKKLIGIINKKFEYSLEHPIKKRNTFDSLYCLITFKDLR